MFGGEVKRAWRAKSGHDQDTFVHMYETGKRSIKTNVQVLVFKEVAEEG